MLKQVIDFCRDEEGATAIEYGLVAMLVSVAAITAFGAMGNSLNAMFTGVSDKLTTVASSSTP